MHPFYMLEGQIDLIKTIETEEFKEQHWEDENGRRATTIIIR